MRTKFNKAEIKMLKAAGFDYFNKDKGFEQAFRRYDDEYHFSATVIEEKLSVLCGDSSGIFAEALLNTAQALHDFVKATSTELAAELIKNRNFSITVNLQLTHSEAQLRFGLFHVTRKITIHNAQLFASSGIYITEKEGMALSLMVTCDKEKALHRICLDKALIKSVYNDESMDCEVDASKIIELFNEYVEMEKAKVREMELDERIEAMNKLILFSQNQETEFYGYKVMPDSLDNTEHLEVELTRAKAAGELLDRVKAEMQRREQLLIEREQKEKQRREQLREKVKVWINKHGSELLKLRLRHNYEFMEHANVEYASMLLFELTEVKGFTLVDEAKLTQVGKDKDVPLYILTKFDSFKVTQEILDRALFTGYIDHSLKWYIGIQVNGLLDRPSRLYKQL